MKKIIFYLFPFIFFSLPENVITRGQNNSLISATISVVTSSTGVKQCHNFVRHPAYQKFCIKENNNIVSFKLCVSVQATLSICLGLNMGIIYISCTTFMLVKQIYFENQLASISVCLKAVFLYPYQIWLQKKYVDEGCSIMLGKFSCIKERYIRKVVPDTWDFLWDQRPKMLDLHGT